MPTFRNLLFHQKYPIMQEILNFYYISQIQETWFNATYWCPKWIFFFQIKKIPWFSSRFLCTDISESQFNATYWCPKWNLFFSKKFFFSFFSFYFEFFESTFSGYIVSKKHTLQPKSPPAATSLLKKCSRRVFCFSTLHFVRDLGLPQIQKNNSSTRDADVMEGRRNA